MCTSVPFRCQDIIRRSLSRPFDFEDCYSKTATFGTEPVGAGKRCTREFLGRERCSRRQGIRPAISEHLLVSRTYARTGRLPSPCATLKQQFPARPPTQNPARQSNNRRTANIQNVILRGTRGGRQQNLLVSSSCCGRQQSQSWTSRGRMVERYTIVCCVVTNQ